MRAYKKYVYFTAVISIVAFVVAVLLHYLMPCAESDFWINVCLGIFSGAILTLITSIISYRHEKRRTMESFVYHTRQILFYLNKYQESMSIEQKLKFFLDYKELDRTAWHTEIGDMDFFFEKLTNNKKYIYDNIYMPIIEFDKEITKYQWGIRWHLDGIVKNDAVMDDVISKLQKYLIKRTEVKIPIQSDEGGNAIRWEKCSSVSSKLVADITKELYGHYYEIMYGMRFVKKQSKSQEVNINGQTKNANSK